MKITLGIYRQLRKFIWGGGSLTPQTTPLTRFWNIFWTLCRRCPRLCRLVILTKVHLLTAWAPHIMFTSRPSRSTKIINNANFREFWPLFRSKFAIILDENLTFCFVHHKTMRQSQASRNNNWESFRPFTNTQNHFKSFDTLWESFWAKWNFRYFVLHAFLTPIITK